MKLMQTNKGEFGYLKRERKRRIKLLPLWRCPRFYFYQYVNLYWYQKFYLDDHCSGRISSRHELVINHGLSGKTP